MLKICVGIALVASLLSLGLAAWSAPWEKIEPPPLEAQVDEVVDALCLVGSQGVRYSEVFRLSVDLYLCLYSFGVYHLVKGASQMSKLAFLTLVDYYH